MNNINKLLTRLKYIEHELKNNLKLDSKAVERQIKLIREKHQIIDEIKHLEIKASFSVIEDEPEEEFEPDTIRQVILWYVIFGGKLPMFCTMTNTFGELLIRAYTPKPKNGGL